VTTGECRRVSGWQERHVGSYGRTRALLLHPYHRQVNQNALDLRGDTVANMSSRIQTRRRRRVLALVLAAVAVGLVVVEPFPKGKLLLSLTSTHGVDTGDIPALAMLLVAAYLAV
jgi:hypothetical protein